MRKPTRPERPSPVSAASSAGTEPALSPWADLSRRVLLGLLVTLAVARPLLPGEDPGLLSPSSSPVGMVVTQLWWVLAAGWALWRNVVRAYLVRVDWLDLGLLLLALTGFIGLSVAGYAHPTWLISWECLTLVLCLFLPRQLLRTPLEKQALLAVLCANVLGQLPHAANQWLAPSRPPLENRFVHVDTPNFLQQRSSEAEQLKLATGTFVQPERLALFVGWSLALFGLAWLHVRQQAHSWLWLVLMLGAVGLILSTLSWRFALLVVCLISVASLLAARSLWGRLGALLTLACASLCFLVPNIQQEARGLGQAWQLAGWIFRLRPMLGVGLGNFGRNSSLFANRHWPDSNLLLAHPSSALLEGLATGGLLWLALAVLIFGRLNWLLRPNTPVGQLAEPSDEPAPRPTRWEFYLGGFAGLLLANLLRLPETPREWLLREAGLASVRVVVWLLTFALVYTATLPTELLQRALRWAVILFVLHTMVASGWYEPSLAQTGGLLIALYLAYRQPSPGRPLAGFVGSSLPVAGLSALGLVYLLLVLLPVLRSTSDLAEARRYYPVWQSVQEPALRAEIQQTKDLSLPEQMQVVEKFNKVLEQRIVGPLTRAVATNPQQAYLHVELAYWLGKQWEIRQRLFVRPEQTKGNTAYHERTTTALRRALYHAGALGPTRATSYGAQGLDPLGRAGLIAEIELRTLFADRLQRREQELRKLAEKATNDNQKADLLRFAELHRKEAAGQKQAEHVAREKRGLLGQ